MGSEVLLYQIPKNVGRASEVGRGQMIEMIGKKQKIRRWTLLKNSHALNKLLIEIQMLKTLPLRAQEEVINTVEKECIMLENTQIITERKMLRWCY